MAGQGQMAHTGVVSDGDKALSKGDGGPRSSQNQDRDAPFSGPPLADFSEARALATVRTVTLGGTPRSVVAEGCCCCCCGRTS